MKKLTVEPVNSNPWVCAVLLHCVVWGRVAKGPMEVLNAIYSDTFKNQELYN